MIETINLFISKGFSLLPVKDDKSPATKKWLGINIDLSEFKDCYGIGIKCGKASNGIECIDFDNHFGNAKQILSEYLNIDDVKEIYQKYKLPIESTISGGFHLLFRCEYNQGNLKLAKKPKLDEKINKWRPDTIIETRGEGGYFVCYPTKGYKVVRNDIFEIETITKEERKILINNAISFNEWIEPKTNEFENKDRPGDYYNKLPGIIEEVKNSLLRAGWKNIRGYCWQRPGKNKGISATLGKAAENIFYNFSANSYPFEPDTGYNPFQVVGVLDYNSDFSRFAKEISEKYNLSTPDTYKHKQEKKKEKVFTKDELDLLLKKSFVDITIPVDKPPIILKINHGDRIDQKWRRMMTLTNISCVTGKGKAKKTFLMSYILSVLGKNYYDEELKFKACLPENKRMVLHFDTEEGDYDCWIVGKRIHDIAGEIMENVGTFNFREFKPEERLKLIGYAIEKFKDNIGVVFIDGIADLVKSVNSEDEADEILHLFLKWTKIYNCHISCVIHQNKQNNFAMGWLGTKIIQKCELIISVEADEKIKNHSHVSCDMIRGAEPFDDFTFYIDSEGYPKLDLDFERNNYV